MINPDEEKIKRLVRGLLGKSRAGSNRLGCPDEEALATYLTGSLVEDIKKQIESHLAGCSFCIDALVAAHKAIHETATERVPQRIIDRAMGLIPSARQDHSVFELVVRLAKDSLELVRTSGRWINPLTPMPAGVRGKPQPSRTSILQVEKEMGKFMVSVEVEVVEAAQCQVGVGVKDSAGNAVDNLRITLLSEGREQASYLTRRGEAVFDNIPQGEYHLSISDSGNPLGTIRLRMEEDGHE